MTVLFTLYRVYMTVTQNLRYPLITSFELNLHLKRAHVLLSVISINTKMSLHFSIFWNQLLLSNPSHEKKFKMGGDFLTLSLVSLSLLHSIKLCHPADTLFYTVRYSLLTQQLPTAAF